MVTTVHRLPIGDSFNFQALAGQLSVRTCDDCGAPADVGLEYYSNGKYTPGEDLCWDCSDRYGPFTSDRAAEKAGREPYVNPGSATRTAGDLDNPDLAEAVRELGEDRSGDVWLAAAPPDRQAHIDHPDRARGRTRTAAPVRFVNACRGPAVDSYVYAPVDFRHER